MPSTGTSAAMVATTVAIRADRPTSASRRDYVRAPWSSTVCARDLRQHNCNRRRHHGCRRAHAEHREEYLRTSTLTPVLLCPSKADKSVKARHNRSHRRQKLCIGHQIIIFPTAKHNVTEEMITSEHPAGQVKPTELLLKHASPARHWSLL